MISLVSLLKGVKKVCSEIKLCSYNFSHICLMTMSLEFFKVGTLDKKFNWMFNQIFCHPINYLQNQIPLGKFLGRRSKMDVYEGEPKACPDLSDKNIF